MEIWINLTADEKIEEFEKSVRERMENLQFRIWCKSEGKMYNTILQILPNSFLAWDENLKSIRSIEKITGILMETVGVKDITGRQIFTGDIIMQEGYGVGVAVWNEALGGEFFVYCLDGNQYSFADFEESKILGNVYQNKDILGETGKIIGQMVKFKKLFVEFIGSDSFTSLIQKNLGKFENLYDEFSNNQISNLEYLQKCLELFEESKKLEK